MDQKRLLIADHMRGTFTMTELCERYGISRKTGYKWIARFETEGFPGLRDRPRRPRWSPNATDPELVTMILTLRRRHPHWGAKKLLRILEQRHPRIQWPSRSTVCDLLDRGGLVTHRRRRHYPGHGGRPETRMNEPNETWCADFKGQFRTRDGIYCYPLTITDGFSRLILGCRGLASTEHDGAQRVFERVFREFGLPRIIRTDNGTPFASNGLGRLTRLSVWWIRLGIYPELIELGHPEQNGRHERMHRTLKQETARPAAPTMRSQQHRFDRFRAEFNDERPHEALQMQPPASRYRPSPREFPSTLPDVEYPAHFELRFVSRNGCMRINKNAISVTHAVVGQHVGLEEIGDGIWDIYYGPRRLGQLNERKRYIEDPLGRRVRTQR